MADDVPGAESLNETISNNATTLVNQLSSNLITLGVNSTIIEGEEEGEVMTTMAVIVKTLPGIPFLLMATCVLGAIVAALFLENITKGMDHQGPNGRSVEKVEEEEEAGNVSRSQSENSETKMEIKSSSGSSSSSLADGKFEVTELTGCDVEEEEGGKIHINGQTIKASYAA